MSHMLKESYIPKLPANIALQIYLLINKSFSKFLPIIFNNWLTLSRSTDSHRYNARCSCLGYLFVSPHNTKLCGTNSVNISLIYLHNYLQNLNENKLFYQVSQSNLQCLIKVFFSSSYY